MQIDGTSSQGRSDLLKIGSGREEGRRQRASHLGASLFLAVVFWGAGLVNALSQQLPTTPPPDIHLPSSGENLLSFFSKRTPYEFWLTCIIILLGVFVIVALMRSISRISGHHPEDISRPIIIVTIVTGTLILVTAGYSNDQIAPAFGLFGTIVGYILGRMGRGSSVAQDGAPDRAAAKSEPHPSTSGEIK